MLLETKDKVKIDELWSDFDKQIKVEANDLISSFDDILDNLQTAKSRGWETIWVHQDFMNKPFYVDLAFPNIYTAVMYYLVI